MSDSDALRAAREIAESYETYCLACKRKIVFYEWRRHSVSSEHLENELALQEQDLKKHPKGWVEKYWPLTGESTRWCPKCGRLIRNADWYAHLESHRTRIKKPVF